MIRSSKKSIALQAKAEIVQGNENVKVVITDVDKSLDAIDRCSVMYFRCGEIDADLLRNMLGGVSSAHNVSSDFDDLNVSAPSPIVTINVKRTIPIGKNIIKLCALGLQAWVREFDSKNILLIDVKGRILQTIDITPQNISCDKDGRVYMCFYNTRWISMLTTDNCVADIANIAPLCPNSLCATQSGDILVAVVDVGFSDSDKCEKSYIARLDNLGREQQRIQFEEDGKTRLFRYAVYVDENKNGDIVVIDKIERFQGRLHVLSGKGKVQYSYNGTSKLKKCGFSPASVCCDNQCRIIVADVWNSALHLLNARGELLQLLMTEKDGLVNPFSLGLCEGFLWIGMYDGNVIVAEYQN